MRLDHEDAGIVPQAKEMTAARHLVESTVYREDVLDLGHSAVWGSLWEALPEGNGAGRWGYACCRSWERHAMCPAAKAPLEKCVDNVRAASRLPEPVVLQQWEEFEGSKTAFVRHVIQWLLQEWRLKLAERDPRITADIIFREASEVHNAEEGIRPLLDLITRAETRDRRSKLKKVPGTPKHGCTSQREDWDCPSCKYRNRGDRIECRKCKKEDPDYVIPDEFPKLERELLEKVGQIVTLAAAQDYAAATELFFALTIGSARWSSDIASLSTGTAPSRKTLAAQGHMQRQAAEMAPLTSIEGRAYLNSLKRLINLAQILRPSDDPLKNMAK
ncbi:unnamed protein product [Prorocentrum cordatum]|uniref:RanBP2-type domain-containing protein n=1 Tax=Prorocentrum cordatum TaxID=2364126 RepID=A0ABN9TVE9_9DINO|nr:unnamed protein product [Polarella glacialis]